MIHTSITAAADWRTDRRTLCDTPTCPDCGSFAQGRGYFGNPYCGLCERTIPEASVAFTTPRISADGLSVAL